MAGRLCILVGGLALLCITGCARVSVENVNVRALGLPRPQMIYVHDFAVSADAVALDSGLAARALEMAKGTETEDRIKIGKEIARIVSENLVNEIRAQGMPAQLAGPVSVPGPTMTIESKDNSCPSTRVAVSSVWWSDSAPARARFDAGTGLRDGG